jgi:streptogramin lyase
MRRLSLFAGGSLVALLLMSVWPAAALAAATIEGRVSSAAEGAMEGVLVSVKKDGSTITTTVVSDAKGHYSFPAGRLTPGHYRLAIRAIGYDLQGPKSADVIADKPTTANLTLTKTRNLSAQLSNAEWLMSFPVSDDKKEFLTNCVGCHTLRRPANSTFTEDQWPDVLKLMASFSAGSIPIHPQPLLPGPRVRTPKPKAVAAESKILAQFNLSQGPVYNFPLKTFPRPRGRAAHVIITSYDLPRKTWCPHDVILDNAGNVWFSDFDEQYAGEMDPKTGKVTQIPIPTFKPDAPKGSLDMEKDPQGNLWLAMMYQGGIVKIDDKTHAVTNYKIPAKYQNNSTQESFVSPEHSNVDGYVWTNDQDQHTLIRLNLKTGKFGKMHAEVTPGGVKVSAYQIPTDLQNNVYLLNFGGTLVGYFDKNTHVVTAYKTPTPHSRPRRGGVDSKNRLWFAEYQGNAVAMFDPKTKRITEYRLPVPWGDPYDAQFAPKYDEVWSGSMLTDMVDRLDLKTGKFTEYLLPESTNIRRVYVDQRGPRPVLWVGSNHGAQVIKVEPLD